MAKLLLSYKLFMKICLIIYTFTMYNVHLFNILKYYIYMTYVIKAFKINTKFYSAYEFM